jgi:hypothetical protein
LSDRSSVHYRPCDNPGQHIQPVLEMGSSGPSKLAQSVADHQATMVSSRCMYSELFAVGSNILIGTTPTYFCESFG